MYIELKAGPGTAWIGRVQFSKTGRTVYYRAAGLNESAVVASVATISTPKPVKSSGYRA